MPRWSWCVVGAPYIVDIGSASYISINKNCVCGEVLIITAFNQGAGNFIFEYYQVTAVCKAVRKLESLTRNQLG